MTLTSPPSMTATTLLVVPRSMPMIFSSAICVLLCREGVRSSACDTTAGAVVLATCGPLLNDAQKKQAACRTVAESREAMQGDTKTGLVYFGETPGDGKGGRRCQFG